MSDVTPAAGVGLSPAAADEIRRTLREQELGGEIYLHVGVRGYGPGRTFTLDLSEQDAEHDLIMMSQGVRLACRRKDLPQLDGVTIDFREVGGSRGFVFRLPDHERAVHASDAADPSRPPPDEAQVRQALRGVIDPEIGINVVDLGLVYGVRVTGRDVLVTMTMTTPACPLSEHIKAEVNGNIAASVPGVRSVGVEIVWEPRWTPDAISAEAKRALGWSR
jgi:metal-sulfur cluster biosynthetic enzyme/Fe-S cluster assembly iron-binding protein IscA